MTEEGNKPAEVVKRARKVKPFVIEEQVGSDIDTWRSVDFGEVTSTREALDAIVRSGDEGRYRVVQVCAEVEAESTVPAPVISLQVK